MAGDELDLDETLLDRAGEWARHDPDRADRERVETWIAAASAGAAEAIASLRAAFAGPLTFGTAGLRGQVGPGESRMNRAVVIRTTAGLVDYLRGVVGDRPRIVIGFDARHGSAAFARDAAEVAAAAGCEAMLLPGLLPTPVLAFAVRHLDADSGVMVTASHNPPADNGYKVYLGGRAADGPGQGVQIVPPADARIAQSIAQAPPADEVPRTDRGVLPLGDEIVSAYLRRAAGLTTPRRTRLTVVLTPMHGVGGFVAQQALQATGFVRLHIVSEQAAPDPDFPTVAFPNPEEPGALDLALARARGTDADLVIALDPDADRCSVAIPAGTPGGWRQLSGDEIGALLGQAAAVRAAQGTDPDQAALACSVVSSRLLGQIAGHHGLRHATTLTGFKWIARVDGLVFGYEEAIGYCTDPGAVRDKDGITAALRVLDLAAGLAEQGRTLQDALDDLARRHGLYATAPVTFRVQDVTAIAPALARLRSRPPQTLAGSPVTQVVDLADGVPALDLPPTDGLLLLTDADDRVIIRPSGTEPKLKCYLEVVLPCPDDGPVPHDEAAGRLRALAADVTAAVGL